MKEIKLVGSVVEDERQLDGSRHVEIVGHADDADDADDADVALRLVVDREGSLREAELSLEMGGNFAVIGFDQGSSVGNDVGTESASEEQLSLHLQSAEAEIEVLQRDDGDIALALTLRDLAESAE